jgi:hypothetical protein
MRSLDRGASFGRRSTRRALEPQRATIRLPRCDRRFSFAHPARHRPDRRRAAWVPRAEPCRTPRPLLPCPPSGYRKRGANPPRSRRCERRRTPHDATGPRAGKARSVERRASQKTARTCDFDVSRGLENSIVSGPRQDRGARVRPEPLSPPDRAQPRGVAFGVTRPDPNWPRCVLSRRFEARNRPSHRARGGGNIERGRFGRGAISRRPLSSQRGEAGLHGR